MRHRFHARHDARARSYIYHVARRRTAFAKQFVWWVKDDLDVERMRAAAATFVGLHDFQSFSDDDPDDKSTEVLVDTFEIHEDGDLILIHVEGSHFIWKMVRRLVGVLVEIGRGGLTAYGGGCDADRAVRSAGAADGTGIRTVSGTRLLRRGHARCARAVAGRLAVAAALGYGAASPARVGT